MRWPVSERKPERDDVDLARQVRELMADKDLVQDFWEQGHGHLWNKTWQKITSAIGHWIIVAVFTGAASGVIVYGSQNGWFK